MDRSALELNSTVAGTFGVAAVLGLLVAACENSAPSDLISDKVSFTLACQGREEVSVNRGPTTTSPKVSGTFITWDAVSQRLYTGQPTVDEPFCVGPAQEECQVLITSNRLTAKQVDLSPGKKPNAVVSYEENVEVDLNTMTGTSFIRSTVGTLTDTVAEIHFRTEVKQPLSCERVGFTPPGSADLHER